MKQIPLPLQTRPEPGFDAFVAGANALALQQVQALAPDESAAPVYLWGPPGSGKTHLLRALTARFRAQGGSVAWFGAADAAPWALAEPAALIVLDACEAFDAAQQHAAFALFVEAAGQRCTVAAAGRLPPVDLPLREDLRTRLGSGPVFAISPLGETEARAVLCQESERRGIVLSDDVMSFLMTRFSRDLKHLMALLDRLDEFALAEHRAVTVPLLKKLFEEEGATL